MNTVRLTAAQAAVRYLASQYVADSAAESRYFTGVWAIFGHGNVAGLGEALQLINQWDIVSQTLTGFHQQLILRDSSQHIPCSALTDSLEPPVWPQVGRGAEALPMTAFPSETYSGFNPVRAGHFQFQRLWIVDDFGQVFDVGEALNDRPDGGFYPTAISQSLVAPNLPTMMQLPPRIVQPVRLSFKLVSAEDDAQDTAFLPSANPICGWVLPNHLDQSLFIFNSLGVALGELQLVGGTLNQRARWNPMPDSATPVGAQPDISNAHLRGFVAGKGARQIVLDLVPCLATILFAELHADTGGALALCALGRHPDDASRHRQLLILTHQIQQHEHFIAEPIIAVGRNEQSAVGHEGHVGQVQRALVLDGQGQQARLGGTGTPQIGARHAVTATGSLGASGLVVLCHYTHSSLILQPDP